MKMLMTLMLDHRNGLLLIGWVILLLDLMVGQFKVLMLKLL